MVWASSPSLSLTISLLLSLSIVVGSIFGACVQVAQVHWPFRIRVHRRQRLCIMQVLVAQQHTHADEVYELE